MLEPRASSSSKQEQSTKKASLDSSKRVKPQPKNHLILDPWNSSSTGHQRPQNGSYSGTTFWRETWRRKLAGQFVATTPNKTQNNSSESAREEWRWMSAQEAHRADLGVADIRRYMGVVKPMGCRVDQKLGRHEPDTQSSYSTKTTTTTTTKEPVLTIMSAYEPTPLTSILDDTQRHKQEQEQESPNNEEPRVLERTKRGIFSSLTFYINGSTYPVISEHKLKRLLAAEGGCISLHLARRSVTHAILPSSGGAPEAIGRAGGLLAAGKLQRERTRGTSSRGAGAGGGKGIKYVTAEWVVESIKAGKKLPEARFGISTNTTRSTGLVGAPVGQRSVYDMFKKK